MRDQSQRIRLSPDTLVRLLLTAVMSVVLALMLLVNSQQASAQAIEPAQAEQELYGLSRDEIVAQLGTHYREVPVAGGIAANGGILEVFASPDGESWTIIVTYPNGVSRVIAEGEGWSFIAAIEGLRV